MTRSLKYRILLVDRSPSRRSEIASILRRAGHSWVEFSSAKLALEEVHRTEFDLIVISAESAEITTEEFVVAIRSRLGFAIAMIALIDTDDTAITRRLLDLGIDDCCHRSIVNPLLLSKINASARRNHRIEFWDRHLKFFRFENKVWVNGQEVRLTSKEYALALLMCKKYNKFIAQSYVISAIWQGLIPPNSRTIAVHLSRVRAKLRLNSDNGFDLVSVYGRGYCLRRFAITKIKAR